MTTSPNVQSNSSHRAATASHWQLPVTTQQAWQLLPKAAHGAGTALPIWARMLAEELPWTAAAFLELDFAHRMASPLEPSLRAAMRWVSASANGSEYAMATATADAVRSGVSVEKWNALEQADHSQWTASEQAALRFARMMTVESDSFTDEQFSHLVDQFDRRQVAAMVLLMAYANFQDRLLICLGVTPEQEEPLPPVHVRFPLLERLTQGGPSGSKSVFELPGNLSNGKNVVNEVDGLPTWLPYAGLQSRLQQQRERTNRLAPRPWDQFIDNLPPGLMDQSREIVWYQITMDYAQQLAVPFELYMRIAAGEMSVNWDRPFGNCLFWMVTDAMKCPYCMGHCEMNWEVVGFTQQQIAELSRKLAGSDWSGFSPQQQRALAFARKLTLTPNQIDRHDIDTLRQDFGDQRAFFIALNCSRYNYMTRISNGFQLQLEEGNPFWAYYNLPDQTKSK